MSQNEIDTADKKTGSEQSSSFLGGGPKFNQAGLNTPMPGEKTADAAPAPVFGGPKVWASVLVIICLVAFLWVEFGDGIGGTRQKTPRGAGIDASSRPDVNPDQGSGR